jgi:hypothetical protein
MPGLVPGIHVLSPIRQHHPHPEEARSAVSKEGSREHWTILRDTALLLLRMRARGGNKDVDARNKCGHDGSVSGNYAGSGNLFAAASFAAFSVVTACGICSSPVATFKHRTTASRMDET